MRPQRSLKLLEAAPRHIDQQLVAVAIMPVRRGRADTSRTRRLRKGETRRSLAGDQVQRRADQRFLEIAVVIAARPVIVPRPAHVNGLYMSRWRASTVICSAP